MALASLALILTDVAGPAYIVVAIVTNALFCWFAWGVFRRDEEAAQAEKYAAEKKLFAFSLTYLALIFASLLVDSALRGAGVI
jgi:protoheme IX farnesyltransferase